MDAARRDPGADTEREVREYFESCCGWTVDKLDTSQSGGADFRICHADRCFLCEVKSISSVRADVPQGSVVDHFVDRRDQRRSEIHRWLDENPDRTLLMPGEEWEWLNASDAEFRRRYGGRKRNTEAKFRQHFETPLREGLENSCVGELPYDLRLDSDELYVPSKGERERFLDWLRVQIAAIERGELPDWRWVREDSLQGAPVYSAHYPFHEPAGGMDTRHVISVRLEGRAGEAEDAGLRIYVHLEGGALNVERVRGNVEKAIGQLRAVASREEQSMRLPRAVVLRFESGLHPLDDLDLLEQEIRGLFEKNHDLSAIAVLRWCPDGEVPSGERGIAERLRFLAATPWVPCFIVYYNGWLSDATEALDPDAFGDKWSTHRQIGPE